MDELMNERIGEWMNRLIIHSFILSFIHSFIQTVHNKLYISDNMLTISTAPLHIHSDTHVHLVSNPRIAIQSLPNTLRLPTLDHFFLA